MDHSEPIGSPPSLLTRRQAAALLGVSPGTLAIWACRGQHGLPMVRCGGAVRYRPADLEKWISDRTITSTKESTR